MGAPTKIARDPAAAIAHERQVRERIASQLSQLNSQRPELLLSADTATVTRLDSECERLLKSDAIHLEKIELLERSQRDLSLQAAEGRKTEALVAFEKRLGDRVAAAERLETAIAAFSAALVAYEASAGAAFFECWPADLFPPLREFFGFASSNLVQRIGSPAVLNIQSAAQIRLREFGQRLGPLAEKDAALASSLVASIRAAPLPAHREELVA